MKTEEEGFRLQGFLGVATGGGLEKGHVLVGGERGGESCGPTTPPLTSHRHPDIRYISSYITSSTDTWISYPLSKYQLLQNKTTGGGQDLRRSWRWAHSPHSSA